MLWLLSEERDTCVLTQQGEVFAGESWKAGLSRAQLPPTSLVTLRFVCCLHQVAGCLPSKAATKLNDQLWLGLPQPGRLLVLLREQAELWIRYAILKKLAFWGPMTASPNWPPCMNKPFCLSNRRVNQKGANRRDCNLHITYSKGWHLFPLNRVFTVTFPSYRYCTWNTIKTLPCWWILNFLLCLQLLSAPSKLPIAGQEA